MATSVNKLKIVAEYDWQGADEVRKQRDDLDSSHKSAMGFSLSWGGIATAAAGAAAAVGAAAFSIGSAMVNMASDAQGMESKFNVVFANVGEKVSSDLDAFAEAVGRSRFELKGYAATLGDTLQPLGFAEAAAGDLSVQLVKLATDLSSFNNMSMDEALQRLQGTLIGSHENALAFGVVINENTLKAELARMGADKLTGAMLEQAKVQARINLLMAGTTAAQGDALRTSEGWANQVRKLQSAITDFGTELGMELLPILTPILQDITELAVKATPTLAAAFKEVVAVAGDVVTVFGYLAPKVGEAIVQFDKDSKLLTAGGFVLQEFAKPFTMLADGFNYLADSIEGTTPPFEDATRSMADYAEYVERANTQMVAMTSGLETQEEYLERVKGSVEESTQYYEDEMYAKEANLQATREAARAAAEHREEIIATTAALQESFKASQEAIGGYFATSLQAGESTTTLEQNMFTMAQQAGVSAEAMIIAAAATGDYTNEQIQAAIKSALLQERMAELIEQVKNGEISMTEAISEAQNYAAELDEMATGVEGLRDRQKELNDEIAKVNGTYVAEVEVNTSGLDALREMSQHVANLGGRGAGQALGGPSPAGATSTGRVLDSGDNTINSNNTTTGGTTNNFYITEGAPELKSALQSAGVNP